MTSKITYASVLGSYRDLVVGRYPDGCPWVKNTHTPERILVRGDLSDLITALFWVDAERQRKGDFEISLHLPLVPGSRQDRLSTYDETFMEDGDILFTLRSVAQAINARSFTKVYVADPHSDVTPALIDRCNVLSAYEILSPLRTELVDKYQAVISPDAGAEKRAKGVARMLGLPLFRAWKTRDVATGEISGFGCEPLPSYVHSALVVDDICDGGGTFLGLRGAVPQCFNLGLYVTHGLFTQGTEKLLRAFVEVICTDSTIAERPGVRVIHVYEAEGRERTE